MEQATIAIQGMSCGHCVESVKRALGQLAGVEVEEVSIGSARLRYDPLAISPREIGAAIEAAGYTPRLEES
jgi:copper chaperone